MLGAIALVLVRDGSELGVGLTVAAIAGSFLVSYTRARAEALGLRGDVGIGSRAERVVVITAGLVLAPWVAARARARSPDGDGLGDRRSARAPRSHPAARTRLTLKPHSRSAMTDAWNMRVDPRGARGEDRADRLPRDRGARKRSRCGDDGGRGEEVSAG